MVSKAPRMISVVMGSAVVARRARAGRGRGAGVPARGRRERRVFGRELSAMGRGYPERSGVTRVRHGFTCTGEASARTPREGKAARGGYPDRRGRNRGSVTSSFTRSEERRV